MSTSDDQNGGGIDLTKYKDPTGYNPLLNNRVIHFAAEDMVEMMKRYHVRDGAPYDSIQIEAMMTDEPKIYVHFPKRMLPYEVHYFIHRLNAFLTAHDISLGDAMFIATPGPHFGDGYAKIPLHRISPTQANQPHYEAAVDLSREQFREAQKLLAGLVAKQQSGLDRTSALRARHEGRPGFLLPEQQFITALQSVIESGAAPDHPGRALYDRMKNEQDAWENAQQLNARRNTPTGRTT